MLYQITVETDLDLSEGVDVFRRGYEDRINPKVISVTLTNTDNSVQRRCIHTWVVSDNPAVAAICSQCDKIIYER